MRPKPSLMGTVAGSQKQVYTITAIQLHLVPPGTRGRIGTARPVAFSYNVTGMTYVPTKRNDCVPIVPTDARVTYGWEDMYLGHPAMEYRIPPRYCDKRDKCRGCRNLRTLQFVAEAASWALGKVKGGVKMLEKGWMTSPGIAPSTRRASVKQAGLHDLETPHNMPNEIADVELKDDCLDGESAVQATGFI
jgi:hypothetical protein